ncbi:MAG TPA: LysM peptidoglycan-binding domain-containing protein [Lentisphaeria bacterium]|nr:LysM peptidoglycan-binding domain-containing protein [Lentisphaeria bacterium]
MSKQKKSFRFFEIGLGLAVLAVANGCANLGATEPVLGGGYSPQPAVPPRATAQETIIVQKSDDMRMAREIAGLRADLRTLQEDQKQLLARIESLELANQAKDMQVKELQNLLSAMDGRFGEVDKEWQDRMERLRTAMEQERAQRRKELENVTNVMASEISKVAAEQASTPTSVPGGAYKEIVVQRGDTLSGIAASSGASIAAIKQLNGLKSDVIRAGDRLKIPVRD